MALVDDKYVDSTDGIKKTIDKGSMGMALDILQRGLYAHPIQSTVRELASNGYDAIKEREVAKSIILGTSTIEDHFDVTKIDGIFHASGWDPTYFDLKWLSDDANCYLYYEEGPQRDTLRFVDHGVGLGKTRLVNYFMLNWSSKRANKDALGKWGLGSKVALSLGVDSFRVITKYNGRKFKFDVFVDKVESVISKFDSKGVANEPFVLVPEKLILDDDGNQQTIPAYLAYCETISDKNGVEIQIEVKKHNKELFFDAIKSQLMYMPNIKFMYRKQGDTTHREIDIAAKVLYKDDNVVISESTIFDKPHILIGAGVALVNYGFVSFNELELEPKRGSVGLIMNINDMEVTPSRESPIWSAKTRAAVLEKYKQVSAMASTYLNNELASEHDYLKWITKAAQVLGSMRNGGSNTSVLGRLASIIDMDDIGEVTYPRDKKILFDTKPKEMFGDSLTVRNIVFDAYRKKVERKVLTDLGSLTKPLYFTKFGSNPFKDRYLFEEKGEFILFNVKEAADLDAKGTLIVASTALELYDSVVIPDDRMEVYLADAAGITEDEDASVAVSAPKVDWSTNRKANKQIVVHKLTGTGGVYDYKFSSYDVYISDLFSTFGDAVVVYTTGGDRGVLSDVLAMFPQPLLSCSPDYRRINLNNWCQHMPIPVATKVSGALFAQENLKYIQKSTKYLSISDFLVKGYDKKTGRLEFSDTLKFAATNSVLHSIFKEKFGEKDYTMADDNIKNIDEDFYNISNFCYQIYRNNDDMPRKDIMKHPGFMQDVTLYNLYKSGLVEASDETLEALLKSINASVPDYLCDVVDNITDVDILDIEVIKKSVEKFNYYVKGKELLALYRGLSSYAKDEHKIIAEQYISFFKLINSTP